MVELDQQIKDKEAMVRSAMALISQEKFLEEQISKYEHFIRPLSTEEEEMGIFLHEIEQMAGDSDLQIEDMRPTPPVKSSTNMEYEMEVQLGGRMEGLMAFVYRLHNSSGLFRVEKIRMNSKAGEPANLNTYMTISKVLVK
ncbi:MAG: type 4a pilus biogenesis protein PilO [Candidatus Omnitrophica bacterium]|nr:type 4a pilus biogenesis protein PilO [Candidatus Omnitrophota bacterium]